MKQILFIWGPFSLPAYGFFTGLAFVAIMHLSEERARGIGFPRFLTLDTLFVAAFGALLGARVFHFAFSGENLSSGAGGTAFLGTLAGAVPCAWLFLKLRKQSVPGVLDICFLYLPLGQAIGRLGCWFYGCCHGRVCSPSFPMGVCFPRLVGWDNEALGSPAFLRHLNLGLINPDAAYSLPVYPTQLIAVCWVLLLFILLRIASTRRWAEIRPGMIVFLYCIGHGIGRGLEEFIRDHEVVFGLATKPQLASVFMLLVGIGGVVWLIFRPGSHDHPVQRSTEKGGTRWTGFAG
jgi:phosphatidylglycerol:prolipoprotein diacylglycerol transferase